MGGCVGMDSGASCPVFVRFSLRTPPKSRRWRPPFLSSDPLPDGTPTRHEFKSPQDVLLLDLTKMIIKNKEKKMLALSNIEEVLKVD
jgi:hypothetical protein